jgi:adenosylcobinamide-phosphate synthase
VIAAVFEYTVGVMAVALLIDAVIGDPDVVWRQVPHPVALLGRLIAALDRALNSGAVRRAKGVLALLVLVGVSGGIGVVITALLAPHDWGWIVEAILAAILIAQQSLFRHFRAVTQPLAAGDLAGARAALARIVGRDVTSLDDSGVARAAIESLAESTADGIVAPVFWGALFGLPGILVYKAVNTADSMIGHRDARYADFGWAAARLDDLLNLAPARLTGLLFVIAAAFTPGADARGAFTAMRRDARKHASPNAGFPEAAMAGALGMRLGGPRAYDGEVHDLPWFGDGRAEAGSVDMRRAAQLFIAASLAHAVILIGLASLVGHLMLPPR